MNQLDCREPGTYRRIPFAVYLFYKVATFVPAMIGLYAIFLYSSSYLWLGGFILLFLIHVSIVYKIKCTHCHYYKLPDPYLQCMWLWGVPKIFKANPSPENIINKIYIPLGMMIVAFYPVIWLINNWILLILYFSSLVVLVSSLFLFTCSKCAYTECPHNRVFHE